MLDLSHYVREWDLSDPQPLAQTATSTVYTVTYQGDRVVLKLLTPIGVDDEQSGAVALDYWNGSGAVKLLRHGPNAHLLEYAEGDNLTSMVERGDDEQAAEIIAETLSRLHASTAPHPDGLWPLGRRFRSLFERASLYPDTIFARAAVVARSLLDDPRDVRVLHGDMHHYNVRQSARGWLAYDPKGVLGERTFDAANTLCNPDGVPDLLRSETRLLRNAEILARIMGVDLGRLLGFIFAYACLSAAWTLEGVSGDASLALSVAENAERHL